MGSTINIAMETEILITILIVNKLFQALTKITLFVLLSFDDSTANTNITTHSSLFAIMFCDKASSAMCIRIALEISINSCKTPCNSTLVIATKFTRLNDMNDSPITTGIIFDNVVDIGIEIEFFLIVLITYCIGGTIRSRISILWLIDAIVHVYLTTLIFSTVDSISCGKAQNKIQKQS